jgi:twitching motility protein PilT
VNQREAGRDTTSFSRALRAALREDPDIIMVGEMRDHETVSLAITAAETGHLVFGTLHTSSAVSTIDRVIDAFPPDHQAQVRVTVSESLRGVICQQLVRRADGAGRVPAFEILFTTPAVSNLIRENRTYQMRSLMQAGRKLGQKMMDQSLRELVQEGTVTAVEAERVLDAPGAAW